jgi:hypothetical protein
MWKRSLFAAPIIWALLAAPAAAQKATFDLTGNAIFPGCKSVAESPGRAQTLDELAMANFCIGALSALVGLSPYLSGPKWNSCAPRNLDPQQLARVVVKFLEAHPERMHEDFRGLALEAIHDAWPCR